MLESGTTMSAKSPWNTHTVLGILHPRPIFATEMTIVSPFPLSYSVESIDEALSYLERHHFSLQCYSYHLQTTCLNVGGDVVVRLQHRKCSETLDRRCSILYLREDNRGFVLLEAQLFGLFLSIGIMLRK